MHVRITNAISAVPAITLLSRSYGLAMRPAYIFLFFAKFEPHIFFILSLPLHKKTCKFVSNSNRLSFL